MADAVPVPSRAALLEIEDFHGCLLPTQRLGALVIDGLKLLLVLVARHGGDQAGGGVQSVQGLRAAQFAGQVGIGDGGGAFIRCCGRRVFGLHVLHVSGRRHLLYGQQSGLLFLGERLAARLRECDVVGSGLAAGGDGFGPLGKVAVELGLVTLPPYGLPYDLAGQRNGRWLLFFANFASLMLVARRFVTDFAEAEKQLAAANVRLEQLLENMLPPTVCQRLRREGHTFADAFGACSVLFADIVGYTSLSESVPNVVNLLDAIFSRFDDLTGQSGLEKIKTIGDAYMVAAGIPEPRPDHAAAAAELALRMQTAIRDFPGLDIRIGISSGAVVAGVIGKKRYIYDLWGDTVNTAARMESQGLSGQIQISEATRALLPPEFVCEDRGEIQIKGKGPMRVFLLKGQAVGSRQA